MSERDATLDEFVDVDEDKGDIEQLPTQSPTDDWKVIRADEVMEITRGASPRPKGDPELFGGDIPWIKIGDVDVESERRTGETEDTVTQKGAEKSKVVDSGTLLVSNSGTCGYPMFAGTRSCVHDGWLILRDYEDVLNPHYLYEYIHWKQNYLESLAPGSTQINLNTSRFGVLEINVPPLEEQRKIASVLYNVDRAIQNVGGIITSLKRIRKGVKQDVFSTGYFQHEEYQESQVGRIPKGWVVKPASELCDDITVGVVTGATENYVDSSEGVPFIRSKDVHENYIDQDNLKYISQKFHDQQSSSELYEGDVITVRTGEPGTSCVVPPELEGSNCFSLIISRPKTETNEQYYSYYVNSPKALDFIDSWKAGGVQDNFNIGIMKRLPIPVPSQEEQQKIVEMLDDINAQIEFERRFQSRLYRLKQGLMQDLLSGDVRTRDKDIEALDEVKAHG